MDKMEWIAPCHFGLESVLKREVQDLGYEIAQVEDGRVTFRARHGCHMQGKHFPENSGADPAEGGEFPGGDF